MEKSSEFSMEKAFLQKLTTVVYDNLNNDQFGSEDLAKNIGLSRSQIHRKLQKINGKSITQFIRKIRLNEAHLLLEKGVGTASEIAYKVGFSSPTYFNKCFHEYFNYTPGEVKNIKPENQIPKSPSNEDDKTINPIPHEKPEFENNHEKNRKLVAIMFTDIFGFTALMGSDEDYAFEILHRNRKIHSNLIKEFGGTLIKEMGDRMLISFNLASNAVRCAIEIQNACKKQEIHLKVGIHEGELVFEGNNVLGEGVNIASRLQEDMLPGCINISGSVYKDIKNKPDIKTEFVMEKRFKNVDESIKVYQVILDERGDPSYYMQTPNKSQPDKIWNRKYSIIVLLIIIVVSVLSWKFYPFKEQLETDISIAVLPFKNLSKDQTDQHFTDGITDNILYHLSGIGEIEVKSGQSSKMYRDSDKSTPLIAQELGASYLLRGSIQRYQENIRIIGHL